MGQATWAQTLRAGRRPKGPPNTLVDSLLVFPESRDPQTVRSDALMATTTTTQPKERSSKSNDLQ